jgi:hypothetical protein
MRVCGGACVCVRAVARVCVCACSDFWRMGPHNLKDYVAYTQALWGLEPPTRACASHSIAHIFQPLLIYAHIKHLLISHTALLSFDLPTAV